MTPEEFKKQRVQRSHSQESLAEALDYSRRQIIRWESGESPIPDEIAYRIRYEVNSWFQHKHSQRRERT